MPLGSISGALRGQGQKLLHQQCWNWGQDILRPEGNLLLEAGFTKQRPPQGVTGSTRYVLRLVGAGCWMLWGFGFFYGTPDLGGVYVNRFQFRPRWMGLDAVEEPIWKQDMIPSGELPPDPSVLLKLAATAVRRIADYEDWVLDRCGLPYRLAVLAQWREAARMAPERLPEAWRALAEQIESTSWPHLREFSR